LRSRLIGFASEGASVMAGEYNGTVVKLPRNAEHEFQSIPLFNSSVGTWKWLFTVAVRSFGDIERLHIFIDSLYTFYHRSCIVFLAVAGQTLISFILHKYIIRLFLYVVDKSLLFLEINGPQVTDFDSVKYCITRV